MYKNRMFVAAALASAAVVFIIGNANASTIGFVESQPSGTAGLTIDQNPIVTAILSQGGGNVVNGLTYNSWAFLANDGTGSLTVFGTMPGGYTPTVGDNITATGTYSPFHQIPEFASLTSITKNSSGNPTASPVTATIPDLNLTTMPLGAPSLPAVGEYLFNLNNVTISSGTSILTPGETWGISNLTLTITDASSNSMTLFYWPTSYSMVNANLFGQLIPQGVPVNLSGFVSVFNSTVAEFTPLTVTSVPEPMPWFWAGYLF